MNAKVINTEAQYRKALAEVERLMGLDPLPGTSEADRLDLLGVLIENYERGYYHFDLPEPVDAILFRMEEQGLLQRDLVPFIGSKSKVSEVLSRKRPLTIQMIRSLHAGLDIPAEVLLQEPKKTRIDQYQDIQLDWERFPLDEMVKRGWIKTGIKNLRKHAAELMEEFLSPLGKQFPSVALCRRTKKEMDIYALLAWTARVFLRAAQECCPEEYEDGSVTKEFMREVARLSWSNMGPLLAQEFLANHGIALIIEPQLSKTAMDGGSMMSPKGPVIGLTLRYDRVDSFWFTLIHELVHVGKHLKEHGEIYIDDLDSKFDDPKEKEADLVSGDVLIPRRIWKTSRANVQKTASGINELAKQLSIHPAIVAGKIRFESHDYTIFNEFVGHNQVRNLFPWGGDV